MADSTGMADLRAENVERVVKGFALAEFAMKNVVMKSPSSAWTETYFQETAAELTAGGNRSIKGIPRLANFPYAEVTWTEKSARHLKHGLEGTISYEDWKTNAIDVIARTLLRIARAVVKSVDTEIYNTLSENDTPVNINTVAITAGHEWDSATFANRDPIQDLLNARKEIGKDNYKFKNRGFLSITETDFANLLGNANVRNAGQFWTDDVTRNGVVGKLVGLKVVVTEAVSDDKAMVGVSNICATWKSVDPLTVVTIENPGVDWTIRAWEIGVTQLINPLSICLITNTQA